MKRGWIIILLVATVGVFVGLVWMITDVFPWNVPGTPMPSLTPDAILTAQNCTYPLAYWRIHPEAYPTEVVIGSTVYTHDELGKILSDGSQDLVIKVKAQLLGAFLNISAGADKNNIEATIFEAYGWLVEHPAGSQLTESEQATGARYINVLETFNLGALGVAACEGAALFFSAETGTGTPTPTSTSSSTPTQTITPTPTGTLTPTQLTGTATYLFVTPTRKVTKTTEPPPQGSTNTPVNTPAAPTPTRTPIPNTPTYTPIPPTPTFTIPPPPTPTFTLPPPPTATYTLPPPQ